MSSLRRGHANLLCIVPILADDLFRGSDHRQCATIKGAKNYFTKMLCKKIKTKFKRGRAGIEPATSPTRRENHTSRPTAHWEASNEDRTRDLVLTRHMLCQLSYRGDTVATGWRANTQRARQAHQKSAKEHTRRDSNPQPPDSKSGALSIAPRVPAANAVGRCYSHAHVIWKKKKK